MPWDPITNRWVTILAPPCSGCGQRVWLDGNGRCSDCALYDEGGQELPSDAESLREDEWHGVA